MRPFNAVGRLLPRPMALSMVIALMLVALPAGSGRHSAAQSAGGSISVSFGPSEIFMPPDGFNRSVTDCGPVTVTCVAQAMQESGASAEAIAFYRLTGWMLTDLAGGSPVQRATIFMPWRANENSQPALLGGTPAVVLPEDEVRTITTESWRSDPMFASLIASYPNVMFWGSGPVFEAVDASPSGGQRFIFDYRMLDGCHACATVAFARIAFDFAPDGTYQSTQRLGLIPPSGVAGS